MHQMLTLLVDVIIVAFSDTQLTDFDNLIVFIVISVFLCRNHSIHDIYILLGKF